MPLKADLIQALLGPIQDRFKTLLSENKTVAERLEDWGSRYAECAISLLLADAGKKAELSFEMDTLKDAIELEAMSLEVDDAHALKNALTTALKDALGVAMKTVMAIVLHA
jgi:hypothetical protein